MRVEGPGSGRGRTPMQERRGCSSEILKRAPKRYKDPVLWAWHLSMSSQGGEAGHRAGF